MVDWLRWWHGTVSDTKFMWVARKCGARYGDVVATWAALLETASQATDRGDVSRFDAEAFDCLLMAEEGTTAAILTAMKSKQLIVEERLRGWEIRQPNREDSGSATALSSTGRSRLHRANKRIAALEKQLILNQPGSAATSTTGESDRQRTETSRVDENRTEKSRKRRAKDPCNEDITKSGAPTDEAATGCLTQQRTENAEPPPGSRRGRICGILRHTGIVDAVPHSLSEDTWNAIFAQRSDEEIVEFARSKLAARPGQRTSLRYLVPGLLEAPKSFHAAKSDSANSIRLRMNEREASRLAAARSIFGPETGNGQKDEYTENEPVNSPASAGGMGKKALC